MFRKRTPTPASPSSSTGGAIKPETPRTTPQQLSPVTPKPSAAVIPKLSSKDAAKENNKSSKEKSKTPTKAQLDKWTSSINYLLADADGVEAFAEFLEQCETEAGENTKYLNFIRDCYNFEREMCRMENEAKRIFETYLEVGSDMMVGTSGKGEEVERKLMEEGFPQKTLFEDTKQKAKDTLSQGLYVDFCKDLLDKHKV